MSKTFTDAAENLADLLSQENQALRAMNLPVAAALVPAKQAALTELTEMPAPPPTSALAGIGQRLQTLAAENRGLLEQAIIVQARIIEIVASAYKPSAATLRYGRNGEQPAPRLPAVALSTRC